MTKSSALRLSGALPPPTPRASVKRQSISTSERAALDRLTRRQSVQLPPIAASPKVEVRMSKAAMLRMGVTLPPPMENTKRTRQSTSTSADGSDASSRRMSVSSSLKSLREPTIAPRTTKSSALRIGSSTASSSATARHRPLTILNDDDSGNVNPSADSASHKRRHSVQVQSTRPPAIEPRMSRASMLRTGQSACAAPSSSSSTRTGLSNVNFDGGQSLCIFTFFLLSLTILTLQYLDTNVESLSLFPRCTKLPFTLLVRIAPPSSDKKAIQSFQYLLVDQQQLRLLQRLPSATLRTPRLRPELLRHHPPHRLLVSTAPPNSGKRQCKPQEARNKYLLHQCEGREEDNRERGS